MALTIFLFTMRRAALRSGAQAGPLPSGRCGQPISPATLLWHRPNKALWRQTRAAVRWAYSGQSSPSLGHQSYSLRVMRGFKVLLPRNLARV